jgi:hypothetical protein
MAGVRRAKSREMTAVGVLLALTTVLLLACGSRGASAEAGPIYVSSGSGCSDARGAAEARNAGTPVCTISRGIALAGASGAVTVRGGSYPALTLAGGSRTSWVTVSAAAGETVSLPSVAITESASWLRFEGLHISSSSGSAFSIAEGHSAHVALVGSDVRSTSGADLVPIGAGSSDVLFDGDAFTGGGEGVAWVADESTAKITNVTVRNSRFRDMGTDALRPAHFDGAVIENNDISGLSENGDHTDAMQSYAGGAHLVFRGNYVHDNANEGFFIKDGHVDDVVVQNNVFAHNSGAASQIKVYDVTGLQLINNTVWDNEANVTLSSRNSDVVIRNNIFEHLDADASVANVTQDHNLIGGTYGWKITSADVKGSPAFVDAAGGDYRLAAGSQGIDLGSSAGATTTDKACRSRYDDPKTANQGAGDVPYVDAGALEYGPGTSAADTAAPAGCAAVITPPSGGSGGSGGPGTTSGPPSGCACAGGTAPADGAGTAGCPLRVAPHGGALAVRTPRFRHGRLHVTIRASRACRLSVRGTAAWVQGGRLRSTRIVRSGRDVRPGVARRVALRLPPRAVRALRAHRRLVVRLRITAAGRTYRRTVVVRR